jgi:hypothetical protein
MLDKIGLKSDIAKHRFEAGGLGLEKVVGRCAAVARTAVGPAVQDGDDLKVINLPLEGRR